MANPQQGVLMLTYEDLERLLGIPGLTIDKAAVADADIVNPADQGKVLLRYRFAGAVPNAPHTVLRICSLDEVRRQASHE